MIFVTVGTHEQGFDRLVKYIDNYKKEHKNIDIFIQNGYTKYKPVYCDYKDFLSYNEMEYYMKRSKIIITHGGPSTYLKAIEMGKKVIVVPRLKKYGEHINNHQLEFIKKLEEKKIFINHVLDVSELEAMIKNTNITVFTSNNMNFNRMLKSEIDKLIK